MSEQLQQLQKDLVFIGDLHGQYQKLIQLLIQLDFDVNKIDFAISRYQLVFIGDLIDNHPDIKTEQLNTLALVKKLVENGLAYCIMGNHELNAVGWATKHPINNHWLRPHTENNQKQHSAFLNEVSEHSEQHQDWIGWFKKLPLYIDFGDIRAIHACWDSQALKALAEYLDDEQSLLTVAWNEVFDKSKPLHGIIETILKGPELVLPEGYGFYDKTKTYRTHVRIRWWLDEAKTYREVAQVQPEAEVHIPEMTIPSEHQNARVDIPVVIGHYTLNTEPKLLSAEVACVDYNAASSHGNLIGFVYHRNTALLDPINYFVCSEAGSPSSMKVKY